MFISGTIPDNIHYLGDGTKSNSHKSYLPKVAKLVRLEKLSACLKVLLFAFTHSSGWRNSLAVWSFIKGFLTGV